MKKRNKLLINCLSKNKWNQSYIVQNEKKKKMIENFLKETIRKRFLLEIARYSISYVYASPPSIASVCIQKSHFILVEVQYNIIPHICIFSNEHLSVFFIILLFFIVAIYLVNIKYLQLFVYKNISFIDNFCKISTYSSGQNVYASELNWTQNIYMDVLI